VVGVRCGEMGKQGQKHDDIDMEQSDVKRICAICVPSNEEEKHCSRARGVDEQEVAASNEAASS